jgi:hypothetical protein
VTSKSWGLGDSGDNPIYKEVGLEKNFLFYVEMNFASKVIPPYNKVKNTLFQFLQMTQIKQIDLYRRIFCSSLMYKKKFDQTHM